MAASKEYDFVIVGGGTAGLVVANRLTEDPKVQVLVLEAGSDRSQDPRVVIPGLATTTWDNDDFDWQFVTVPQVCLRPIRHVKAMVR